MYRSLDRLLEFKILALDGEMGKVHDFYFDSAKWAIRYLVVDTGPWIFGRRVLITKMVIGQPEEHQQILPVRLRKEEVRDSPDIDTELPVSRKEELLLEEHYHWPLYHQFPLTDRGSAFPPIQAGLSEAEAQQLEQKSDPDLRRIREVKGYQVHGRDGRLGVLEDCIVDDQTWQISYLVLDTGQWLDGKRVLIDPQTWVQGISYPEAQIQTSLIQQHIQDSPPFEVQLPAEEIQIR